MEYLPVKTRILVPPQDDLFAALDEANLIIKENDIVLISSKVVAIHQGNCAVITAEEKQARAKAAADLVVPRAYATKPITVTHNAFLSSAGIDESNGNGYCIILPKDLFAPAAEIYKYFCQKFALENIGVIITDTASKPFRYGAHGVALAWWGIEPLQDHRGRTDLFGRTIKYERSNLVDGLAAGAVVLGGEVDECTPVVIARGVPNVTFTKNKNTKDDLFADFTDDSFRVLYEQWL